MNDIWRAFWLFFFFFAWWSISPAVGTKRYKHMHICFAMFVHILTTWEHRKEFPWHLKLRSFTDIRATLQFCLQLNNNKKVNPCHHGRRLVVRSSQSSLPIYVPWREGVPCILMPPRNWAPCWSEGLYSVHSDRPTLPDGLPRAPPEACAIYLAWSASFRLILCYIWNRKFDTFS
jgi:hypothetical protein